MSAAIVAGVGSEGSGHRAARFAAALAADLGAPLLLVFGYDPILLGGEVGDLRAKVLEFADRTLGELKATLSSEHPDLEIENLLVEDRPVESLVFVAEQRAPRAVVVGHGGRGPLTGALLGSVSYEIVHRCPVPVIVVPDEE